MVVETDLPPTPLPWTISAATIEAGLPPTAPKNNGIAPDAFELLRVGRMPPESIRAETPRFWEPGVLVDDAMSEWDDRHARLLDLASGGTWAWRANVACRRNNDINLQAIKELRRSRFFTRDPAGGPAQTFEKRHKKATPKKKWYLVTSIWGPRRKTSDSKDFYDPPEVKQRAFSMDWQEARESQNMEKKLARSAKRIEQEADRAAASLTALEEAMCAHCDLIYGVFHYYSAQGATDDIYAISLNSCAPFRPPADESLPVHFY